MPESIQRLVEKFEAGRAHFTQPDYNEAQLRQEFVNPFFAALGWDVGDSHQVLHEAGLKSGGSTKHPDYSFLAGRRRAFYVETKKPAIDISQQIEPAGQLRSYGWSGNTAVGILTNFAEFAVYDCRIPPEQGDPAAAARVWHLTSAQYPAAWTRLQETLSPLAVRQGKHKDLLAELGKGVLPVDAAFLRDMENWRGMLAEQLYKQARFIDRELNQRELNQLVQRTIDRIVFLRIAEDRNLEPYGTLERVAREKQVYEKIKNLYRSADRKYNSGLFHFDPSDNSRGAPDKLSMDIYIPDNVLQQIVFALYPPQSRYEFSVIAADILGQVYERFLGKVIEVRSADQETRVVVEEKPEVRKAGGVYYTPETIVDYIVENTLGKLLDRATPDQAEQLRVLDPACGSGSFLTGAYSYLLDWHIDYYRRHPTQFRNRRRETSEGILLTTSEKRRILLNNIYGVDLDQSAVEVTKLSLLLKMLENENDSTGLRDMEGPILPDLGGNIKWGNSLVGSDFYDGADVGGLADEELQRVKAFDWDGAGGFADIMAAGGFDAVIGNPPYVRQETLGAAFKAYTKHKFESYVGTADLYIYFIEQSHRLLKANGRYGVICSNKFLRSNYGKGIRQFLSLNSTFEQLIDFGELRVFSNAATFPMILIAENDRSDGRDFIYASIKHLGFGSLKSEVDEIYQVLDRRSVTGDRWTLASKSMISVLDKINSRGIELKAYTSAKVYRGLITGLNTAFVIDKATRDAVVSREPRSLDLIHPYALGDDIRKYSVNFNERYLILIPKGWTKSHVGSMIDEQEAWNWFSDNYSALAEHLAPFQGKARKRLDKGDYWWELRACDYYSEFNEPKIIYPDIAKESRIAFDTTGLYATNTVWFIPTDDKYLLGILNSSLIFNYFKHFASVLGDANRGGRLRWFRQDVLKLPIRAIDFDNPTDVDLHDRMVALVDDLLDLHRQLVGASDVQRGVIEALIARRERAVDELVYELYGLSEGEVGVVEG